MRFIILLLLTINPEHIFMEIFRRAWAEIDIQALIENFKIIRDTANQDVFAVIKADAYGHGAVKVAQALEDAGVFAFAVSNLLEAEKLRTNGITKPILILGYTPPECADRLAQNDIHQSVFSLEFAQQLDAYAKKAGVVVSTHLKLDTGMGRIGLNFRDNNNFQLDEAKEILALSNLDFQGVFMHFAVADCESEEHANFTNAQQKRFLEAVNELEKVHHFPLVHYCNSAATLTLAKDGCNAIRAGIILYGLAPSNEVSLPEGMRPAMSLYATVSMVKTIEAQETVSYGRTYAAPEKRRIATICAGYADGIPRLLSNKGYVLIHGKKAPIVGRVCMDQFCVDVTDIPEASQGDSVTVFGQDLSVDEVADIAQTINYEIVCGISKRVPRIYINEERMK